MSLNFCILSSTDGSGKVAINPVSVTAIKQVSGKSESQVLYNGGHVTVVGVVEEIVLKLLDAGRAEPGVRPEIGSRSAAGRPYS